MKKLLLRALFILIPFLYSIYASSQPKKSRDCITMCFSTEVLSVQKLSETCTAYEFKVSYAGNCAHALSHFTVAVPCGNIENLWNSQNWKQVLGTDPTTGLSGFKIDDIQDFGESSLQEFAVKFNLCSVDESCAGQLSCWQPQVAYKASTCVNYETLTVSCKTLKASLDKQDASCFGAMDGSISIVIEDGHEPYTYLWSDPSAATTSSITGLAAGTYTVVIHDASGAELSLVETVHQPERIIVAGNPTHASCNGASDGAIDLIVSGGSGGYSYLWSNGLTTEDVNSLPSGSYSVKVTDSKNCQRKMNFTISGISTIHIEGKVLNPDCNTLNGSIDITVTGGVLPYSYTWAYGNRSEADLKGLGAGLYTVTVTDNTGCTGKASYFLTENNTLALSGMASSLGCADDVTGSIELTVNGGTEPYSYKWSNDATTEDLPDLASGSYTVTVRDGKGCIRTKTFQVSQNTFQVPQVVVKPLCYGEQTGSITLQTPVGGTSPFTYSWEGEQTGTALTDLGQGTYTVTITDAGGCSQTLSIRINDPSEISASATVSNAQCNEENAFAIDLTVAGGKAPYSYSWSNDSVTEDIYGLSTGTYTVIVTDNNGCTKTCVYTVSACTSDDDGGTTDPGDEEPGEDPDDGEGTGDQTCEECFSTEAALIESTNTCHTYEMVISTNGLCRHDLSHWTLEIPCGIINNYTNSEGWKMEFGKDPTTGLYGLKVDDINDFGKTTESFTVRFTICENNECDLSGWNPRVAYKAGLCVGQESIEISRPAATLKSVSVYPNPFSGRFTFGWNGIATDIRLEIIDQFGNTVSDTFEATSQYGDGYYISLEGSGLPRGMYYYRFTADGKTQSGKISKR